MSSFAFLKVLVVAVCRMDHRRHGTQAVGRTQQSSEQGAGADLGSVLTQLEK